MGYGNPSVKGYTAVNVNNSTGKPVFRIDFDPVHGIHAHYGTTKKLMATHRKGASSVIMGIIGGTTGILKNTVKHLTK